MMSDDEPKELLAQLAVAQVKTGVKLAKLAALYGGVGNNQGKVAAKFSFNSLKQSLRIDGLSFDLREKNVTRYAGGIRAHPIRC